MVLTNIELEIKYRNAVRYILDGKKAIQELEQRVENLEKEKVLTSDLTRKFRELSLETPEAILHWVFCLGGRGRNSRSLVF